MVFANDITFYFIFILDYGNGVRQKENSSNFLFQIQAAETTCSINNVFGPGASRSCSAVMVQEVLQRRREP